jgi:hypothetical protein
MCKTITYRYSIAYGALSSDLFASNCMFFNLHVMGTYVLFSHSTYQQILLWALLDAYNDFGIMKCFVVIFAGEQGGKAYI